jgi:phage terminase large subunit-like protein
MLVADGHGEAACYSAATTRDQAKVIAEICWLMAKRSPAFCEHFGVRIGSETTFSLAVPAKGSKFQALSADANSLDGLNISFAAIDELHAHRTPAVWQVIDTGTGARPQPLILATTTAGVDTGGICHQKLQYLRRILDQTATDERFFGIEYTIDQDDDIRDLAVQKKANPNFGVSFTQTDLERKVAEAQVTQSELNNVLTKHFNVWIRSDAAWMMASTWQTCHQPGLKLEDLKEFPLWIGVDLGETRDPSSIALLFKLTPENYAFIPRIYVPEDVIARSPTAEMSGWDHTKAVIKTGGNEADYQLIEDELFELIRTFQVREVDFDRRSARLMMQKLRARLEPQMGRDRVERLILDIPQDVATMDPAMKTLEALVLAKKIQHDGNPCMAWMVANIVVERDHKGQIYPRKAGGKDSPNKIDGAVALFTALSQAMQQKEPEPQFQMFTVGGGGGAGV